MQELEKILCELEKYIFTAEVYNDDFDGTTITNLICLGDVRAVLEDRMNDDWIPVEERLPEVTEEDIIPVEVTTMGGLRTVGCYFEYMNEWYALDGDSKLDVIAWKEPSEPYQPERSEGE